jgi:hypothetical protein
VEVSVCGWVDEATDVGKDAWIGKYSAHSLIFLEVRE